MWRRFQKRRKRSRYECILESVIFSCSLVSFTITEKGYALQKADGTWFSFVEADIQKGPDKAVGAMAVLTAMLYERYKAGAYPLALVSMDNCSQNGAKLRESVLTLRSWAWKICSR